MSVSKNLFRREFSILYYYLSFDLSPATQLADLEL